MPLPTLGKVFQQHQEAGMRHVRQITMVLFAVAAGRDDPSFRARVAGWRQRREAERYGRYRAFDEDVFYIGRRL